MRQVTTEQLKSLLENPQSPCISIYQPTHRHFPGAQQDPIRFKNILKDLETSIKNKYPGANLDNTLKKMHALANDQHFWNHRTDGLAILATQDTFEIFDVQRQIPELLMVSDRFHIKPLLRITQSADRFQVLCLNREEAKLYEGNRDTLDSVDVHFPATLTDALGNELTDRLITKASYGGAAGGGQIGSAARGSARSGPGGGGSNSSAMPMVHGHGSNDDEMDKDRDRFFRIVGEGMLEYHSRPSNLPLILAALPEHHKPFSELCRNPFLSGVGIKKDPRLLDLNELRVEAWGVLEPLYLEQLESLKERFQSARAAQRGSPDLSDAARAAVEGRIATLLVEAERIIPGSIDDDKGTIETANNNDQGAADMLDSLAEIVLRTGGEVVVVPVERMPSDTGLAAIYRY